MVDWLGKTRISFQCLCLIAPLRYHMNQHCEKRECPFQTLEGRSLIGYYTDLFHVITSNVHSYTIINHGLCCISLGAEGMTMHDSIHSLESLLSQSLTTVVSTDRLIDWLMAFTAHQPMWVILCRKRLYGYILKYKIYVIINKGQQFYRQKMGGQQN